MLGIGWGYAMLLIVYTSSLHILCKKIGNFKITRKPYKVIINDTSVNSACSDVQQIVWVFSLLHSLYPLLVNREFLPVTCLFVCFVLFLTHQASGSSLKKLECFEGGTHNDTWQSYGYFDAIARFLQEVVWLFNKAAWHKTWMSEVIFAFLTPHPRR